MVRYMTFVSGRGNRSPILVPMDDRTASLGRNWFLVALGFLAIAATIGALLRLIYVVDMPWLVFKPWLHAHSHVAMLGWLFPAMLIALLGQDQHQRPRGFALWMGVSQLFVLGMLVAFPIQGYGPVSIAFSVGQMIVG